MTTSKKKIKVLRIINRFNLGGPTFNVAYLTKYMSDEFETKLIGGEKDDSEASSEFILESVGLSPTYIPEMKRSISPKHDFIAYQHIKRLIAEFKPDIVHTHASKAGTLGRLAAIHSKVPIVLHTFHGHVFHSYFGTLQTAFYKFIERYLAKRSTKIIAISKQQKLELCKIHNIASAKKTEIIPLGFDLTRFNKNQEEKRNAFRSKYDLTNEVAISIIGRLVPVKDHKTFLRAVKQVSQENDLGRYFIVGDGELGEELRSVCNDLGLGYTENLPPTFDQPVCFTSWIKDVDTVVAGSDIIALTSLNEGTPVSLIEAQAGAKAIVSTKVGGIQDIVIEGQTALLSDKMDSSGLAKNLSLLIKNSDRRTTMGIEGRKHVLHKFSYQRLVSDMETLYLKLIEENQA